MTTVLGIVDPTLRLRVYLKKTGTAIKRGQCVQWDTTAPEDPTVGKSDAPAVLVVNADSDAETMGIAMQDIAPGTYGEVCILGVCDAICATGNPLDNEIIEADSTTGGVQKRTTTTGNAIGYALSTAAVDDVGTYWCKVYVCTLQLASFDTGAR